jgi:hypothetical protein
MGNLSLLEHYFLKVRGWKLDVGCRGRTLGDPENEKIIAHQRLM